MFLTNWEIFYFYIIYKLQYWATNTLQNKYKIQLNSKSLFFEYFDKN